MESKGENTHQDIDTEEVERVETGRPKPTEIIIIPGPADPDNCESPSSKEKD